MKLYKIWLDIEEHDTETGGYRSLAEDGEVSPVPVGQFSSLEAAVRFAESLGIDLPRDQIAHSAYWN